jgi:hypothetical protein
MQSNNATYGSFQAVTPSDTTLVTCKAIQCGGAGVLTLSPSATAAVVALTVTAGQIVPIELNQGRIMATGTTATLIVALA